MAQRKTYNPNTKYGRKKLREQWEERKAEMTPEERAENNLWAGLVMVVIVFLIGGCLYAVGGKEAVIKYMKR